MTNDRVKGSLDLGFGLDSLRFEIHLPLPDSSLAFSFPGCYLTRQSALVPGLLWKKVLLVFGERRNLGLSRNNSRS
jgi:hypothetical protein